jgi:hypothetical protein
MVCRGDTRKKTHGELNVSMRITDGVDPVGAQRPRGGCYRIYSLRLCRWARTDAVMIGEMLGCVRR